MEDCVLDLRDAPQLRAGALALNAAAEEETSPLDPARLDAMLAQALRAEARVGAGGELRAFLIAFDQDAAYDSPNFLWLRDRLPRFAYVDRVVVAPAARGRGRARALYAGLFEQARALGLGRVLCEVNVEPPNPGSDAFHARLGFGEIGRASRNAKTVRYLSRSLD